MHMYFVQSGIYEKYNGGMRKEFINYIFVFDKSFGPVPTYQHEMRDQNLVVRGINFKVDALLFNKN